MRRLGHTPVLDGLRGLAVAGVVAAHGWSVGGGQLGVDLFFVLSGFLITSLLLGEHATRGAVSLRGFYRRRAFRLVPALLVFLVAYSGYELLVLRIGPGHIAERLAVALTCTTDLTWILDRGLMAPNLGHLWTLALQEQFYLVWPPILVLLLRSRRSLRKLALGLTAIATLLSLESMIVAGGSDVFWWRPDAQAFPLLIGAAAAISWSHGAVKISRVGALAGAFLTVAGIELCRVGLLGDAIPIFAIGALLGLLYLVDNPTSPIARLLSLRPIVWFGKISYGIYLWHIPFFHLIGPYKGLLLAMAIAWLSYRFVEQPLVRRGRATAVARPPRVAAGEILATA